IDDGIASQIDRDNRIKLLQVIDNLANLEAQDLIQKAHIKDKFQAHDSEVIFSSLAHSTGLCSIDRDLLKTRVSLEEIKTAVWDCDSNKAPGPDGFTFGFIKKYWDLLRKDIFKFVNSFFDSGLMPQGANSSFFMLIPKVSNPIHIKEFRPISLIGVHYNIISKILTNQLFKVIDKIVSKE
ncbi:hypothetical protein Tco_1580746, partial [Tanacetum coccineum]